MNTEDILKQLIQIPSESGHEDVLGNYIYDFARKHRLPVVRQDKNIVIYFNNHSQKAIILNAHLDTVNPGEKGKWKYPFIGSKAGVIVKDKIYGLGSSDDKSGVAALLSLALLIKNTDLPNDVFIVFVVNEEVDGSGSETFVKYFNENYQSKYQEVAAVIGEPTNLDYIGIGHKGNAFISLTTKGDSGHSSKPDKIKKHSIHEMLNVINCMKEIEKKARRLYRDKLIGSPSFCLTSIFSSLTSLNKVAETCTSSWDIRTTLGFHGKVISFLKSNLGNKIEIKYIEKPAPCGLTNPTERIVKVLSDIANVSRFEVEDSSNDICYFTKTGIPAVTFGPGDPTVMHQPNEYCSITKLNRSVRLYEELISKY